MAVIVRNSPLPLYHQLKQVLLAQMESGALAPGDLVPGEQELQDTYGLSRTTVRQALRELEIEGRITRHRGRGTFVSVPKVEHSPGSRTNLTESLRARGLEPGWRVLAAGEVVVPDELAARLGVGPGTKVFAVRRLRLASDEPIGVHVAHVAPAFRGLVDPGGLERGGSLDYLRTDPLVDQAQADRVLEALPCRPDDARLLGLEPGAPVLRIDRLLATPDGQPIELLTAVYRGDRFKYHLSSAAGAL